MTEINFSEVLDSFSLLYNKSRIVQSGITKILTIMIITCVTVQHDSAARAL